MAVPQESGQNIHGDGWIFEHCDWGTTNGTGNPEYSFVSLSQNQPALAMQCIGARFDIGQYTKATFIGCHWENTDLTPNSSYPRIIGVRSNSKKILFQNCFFYGNYVLETDMPSITYNNCSFMVAQDQVQRHKTFPLASNLRDLDFYHVKCNITNCNFGYTYNVTLDDYKRWRLAPKSTARYQSIVTGRTLLSSLAATGNLASGSYVFPEAGEYTYDIYLFATGHTIATDYAQIKRTVVNASASAEFDTGSLWGYTGGWRVVVFRTSPSAVVQKSEFYFNPVAEYNNSTSNLPIKFKDYGHWAHNEVSFTDYYITPWITVAVTPSTAYTVNSKLFEKNGVLVTSDNSTIGLNNYDPYSQTSTLYTPSITSKTASYTLDLDSPNNIQKLNHATVPIVVTVPTNTSVPIPIGTEIVLTQYGAAACSVTPVDGTVTIRSINGALKLVGQYASATLCKIDTDEWLLVGAITP